MFPYKKNHALKQQILLACCLSSLDSLMSTSDKVVETRLYTYSVLDLSSLYIFCKSQIIQNLVMQIILELENDYLPFSSNYNKNSEEKFLLKNYLLKFSYFYFQYFTSLYYKPNVHTFRELNTSAINLLFILSKLLSK